MMYGAGKLMEMVMMVVVVVRCYLFEVGFGPLGTSCALAPTWRVVFVIFGCNFMDWDEGERSLLVEKEPMVIFNWSVGLAIRSNKMTHKHRTRIFAVLSWTAAMQGSNWRPKPPPNEPTRDQYPWTNCTWPMRESFNQQGKESFLFQFSTPCVGEKTLDLKAW